MDKKFAKQLLDKTAVDYEKIAEEFTVTRFLLWPEFDEFIKYIKKDDKVLDLGCGNGRLYELFKDLSTLDYTGIDKSPSLIESAKNKWKNTEAKFKVGDIIELSETQKYDAVFLIAVLHHIPTHEFRLKILKNVYSILKPGGMLFMMNWKFWQKRYFFYIIKYTILKLIGKSLSLRRQGHIIKGRMDFKDVLIPWKSCGLKPYGHSEKISDRYYHVFTKKEIKNLVKQAGFSIIKNEKSKWNYVTICRK